MPGTSQFRPDGWHIAPFTYRAAPGQGAPVTLATLISDHYGGADRDTADHVERFYFTRELGGTRWERWQNARGNRQFSATEIARRAAWFAGTGRCGAAEPPAGNAPMVLVDCREWTRIVPPADPAGDPPGFWIESIRGRPEVPKFFLEPIRGAKIIGNAVNLSDAGSGTGWCANSSGREVMEQILSYR